MLIDFIQSKVKETKPLPERGELYYTKIPGTKKTVEKAK